MSTAMPAPAKTATGGWRARIQRFGGFLAGMVIPNIGAFIAWGLITAFFIETGWIPNENLAELVGPMIFFLLPILIGYTGGYLVHGQRGAVVGAIATAGVAIGGFVGTDVGGELVQTPMFLGAMIAGPLGGWLIKQFDGMVAGRIRSGFEMLVGNFSAGILGAHPRDPRLLGDRTGRRGDLERCRQRRGLPGRQHAAAARLDRRGAGEGPVPEQRDQPRRPGAARRPGGRRDRGSRSSS